MRVQDRLLQDLLRRMRMKKCNGTSAYIPKPILGSKRQEALGIFGVIGTEGSAEASRVSIRSH
jgi:hypothetical protein